MAFLEKCNWVILLAGVPILVVYGAIVLPQALTRPIAEVSYVQPMVYTIIAFIAANILGNIAAAITNPAEADKKDLRDKEIDYFGERVGNSFIAVGFAAGLILAMARADYFWIANALYLTGMVGGLLGAVTKIAAYHGPFQRW